MEKVLKLINDNDRINDNAIKGGMKIMSNNKFDKITENGIKYLVHPKGSLFAGMKIRENPDDAFENAIKRGMKKPEDWMYMHSNMGRDYFKHCDFRFYKSYPQFGIIETIKRKIERSR